SSPCCAPATELGQAGGQELALGGVLGSVQGGLILACRFRVAAEAAQQVGADGVEQVVAVQVQFVDQVERAARAVDLGDRDRAVQRDDWGGRVREQLVVEREDLGPVGVRGGRCVAVHRVDRRLDLVRAGLVPAQALPDQR